MNQRIRTRQNGLRFPAGAGGRCYLSSNSADAGSGSVGGGVADLGCIRVGRSPETNWIEGNPCWLQLGPLGGGDGCMDGMVGGTWQVTKLNCWEYLIRIC